MRSSLVRPPVLAGEHIGQHPLQHHPLQGLAVGKMLVGREGPSPLAIFWRKEGIAVDAFHHTVYGLSYELLGSSHGAADTHTQWIGEIMSLNGNQRHHEGMFAEGSRTRIHTRARITSGPSPKASYDSTGLACHPPALGRRIRRVRDRRAREPRVERRPSVVRATTTRDFGAGGAYSLPSSPKSAPGAVGGGVGGGGLRMASDVPATIVVSGIAKGELIRVTLPPDELIGMLALRLPAGARR
jgi:hypothetical protein